MKFLPVIKQACDAVINVTTGGSVKMTIEERLAAPLRVSPEMCSLNMGSMNFALYPMADRYREWKYPWEEPYLRESDDNIFRNTFRDIETISRRLGKSPQRSTSTFPMLAGVACASLVRPPHRSRPSSSGT